MIIKELLGLTDGETVEQIRENSYLQCFIGYAEYSSKKLFDPSLMAFFRVAKMRQPRKNLLRKARRYGLDLIKEKLQVTSEATRAVVVHEAGKTGGAGGEISAVIIEEAFDYLDAPVLRCAGIDVTIPFSPDLKKIVIPGEKEIIDAVKSLF